MKKIVALVGLLVLLQFSCTEPPVVFMGPQPEGINPGQFIDMIYRGTFLCESDSALVHVKGRMIYKEKAYSFSISPQEIQEADGVDLIGDQMVVPDWPEPIPVTVTDSMVYGNVVLRDTLFDMGPGEILKYHKGHLVLNKKITDEKWEVMILSLDLDLNLRLSVAEMPDDLKQLKKITPVKDISTEDQEQILLSPTYLQFDEILRQRLIFEECDVFQRTAAVLQI